MMKQFLFVGVLVSGLSLMAITGCGGGGTEVVPAPEVVESSVPEENTAEYAKSMAESMNN